VTRAAVQRGEIVFIHGAGGGVATAAIQIAKYLGATVITSTSSPEKAEKAKALGADHVINYKQMPDFSKYVYADLTGRKGVDAVIDSVGAKTFSDSVRLLRAGGRLVTCGATTGPSGQVDIRNIFWKQLEIYGSTMSNQAEFRAVMKLVFSGALSPVIDRIFPLSEAKEAEKYLNQANQFGKVLLEVK
jgi:NADPH:quinone reductase-like Zn-dependent oxidoreductase